MQRLITRMAAILAVAMAVVGCGGSTNEDYQSIMIKGSDTMVNLASAWAEVFMAEHENIDVAVTGGGSGTGIAALINGTTDICASSRAMKQSEIDLVAGKGIEAVEIIVGMDGIAVIVNPENPVETLDMAQLKGIYTGTINNWSEVGGPEQKISVLSRESNSGTYVFFQEHVLEKQDYRPDARLMTSSAAETQAVKDDKWSIGYVGVAYAMHAPVKIVDVKPTADKPAVKPTDDNVQSGAYPIARPLFLYTNGQPTGAAKTFIDFCKSPEGQRIVHEVGYVPMPTRGQ